MEKEVNINAKELAATPGDESNGSNAYTLQPVLKNNE